VPVSIGGSTIGLELEQVVAVMRQFRPELPLEYGETKLVGMGRLANPWLWRRR